jgi:tRNA pseudouridine55 synthase
LTALLEGLLLVDKPVGPTSHDIVSWVRRATGQRRVGHTGTLDPPASGLLVLALGRATRLIRFLPDAPKVYEGTLALGLTTDTDDLAGNVIERAGQPLPGFEAVRAAATGFLGKQLQVPPAVSARKIGGERMYRLARRGQSVDAPPTEIEVFRFELRRGTEDDRIPFRAEVGKGTYIRSLARDLGQRLGCGGALAELRRTAIGPFDLAAVETGTDLSLSPIIDLSLSPSIPLDRVPLTIPTRRIERDEIERFAHGGGLPSTGSADGWVRVADPEDRILGVGQVTEGLLSPRVVLVDPTVFARLADP